MGPHRTGDHDAVEPLRHAVDGAMQTIPTRDGMLDKKFM